MIVRAERFRNKRVNCRSNQGLFEENQTIEQQPLDRVVVGHETVYAFFRVPIGCLTFS